ncbi:TPA: MFS transporter [Providencia stuartii]|uniref:MFS transporter n=3 Tax=Providencia stuartii TaxID=588 RepID=A0AAJ1NBE8_PROST|nr:MULTISPECIES: MFS transporter [Providencia]SST04868.1 major facilitator superfamily permease [Acinetobacter baumannii]AFH93935.1 multidrug efflux protein [Providencia stuartii MRSN 2154]AIN63764.1 sugar (and other) transporter family protein [Providencia stuartii]AMG67714.1 MFS transporter [Providencia stuartii]APG51887.1 MFS transporter [Providencia stuartii]
MLANYKRWIILLLVSSVLFLIVIDVTVLYTALPRLTHDLGATSSEKLWIMNAYPLIVAGLLPAAGMLSDRIGHKVMFLLGLPLFAVASLCAAFSPTAMSLILSRGFLAVGAALSMPATLSIVRHVFLDPKERALAIGIWSAVASGGAAIGPLVGGALLNHFWWGSVFLINVPVVLLVLPFAYFLIPKCGGTGSQKIDYLGSGLVLVGLVGIIYALKELGKPYTNWWELTIVGVIGGLFLWLFSRRQIASESPMIDFKLFSNPRFSAGILMAILSMVIIVGVELLLSQRLQLVQGYTPLQAALYIIPIPIASVLAGPLTGMLLHTMGERRLTVIGFVCTLAGVLGLISIYQTSTGFILLLFLFLIGFGLGIIFTTASTTVMLNAPDKKAGMAASIEEVAYEIGSVLGVTFMGGLMSAIYTMKLSLPDSLVVDNKAYDSIDEAFIVAEHLPHESANLLINQAHIAFDQAFFGVMVSTAIIVIISTLCIPYFFRKN